MLDNNTIEFSTIIEELYEFLDGVLSPFFHHFGSACTIFSITDYELNHAFAVDKNKFSPFCNHVRETMGMKGICIECDKRMLKKSC